MKKKSALYLLRDGTDRSSVIQDRTIDCFPARDGTSVKQAHALEATTILDAEAIRETDHRSAQGEGRYGLRNDGRESNHRPDNGARGLVDLRKIVAMIPKHSWRDTQCVSAISY
jgi:hypothetical protein